MTAGDPDVLVIGAGPAGALAAALLSQRGHRVLVLERERFPRFSIGESLLANTTQLLDEAGMLDAVLAAGFQYKNGASFVWGQQLSEFNFADKTAPGCSFTFQVKRADFDHILAREAARYGAEVRHQVEIVSFIPGDERPTVGARAAGGDIELYRPRFVLDASGFGRVLPRLLGLDKPSAFPERAALFGHVRDGIPAGTFDRQKIRIGVHPVHRDVWSWLIPFSDGTSSLGVVAAREHHQRHQGSPAERLRAMVRDEPELETLVGTASPTRPIGEITGYAANVSTLSGPGFALLGNAAEFLDPVFSSGVTIAFQSAKLATLVLDRQLRGESVDWDRDFGAPLRFGVETFRTFVNAWYDGSLLDVIFSPDKEPHIHRLICSVLAGYAWDAKNPYAGPNSARRLRALAALCRST